MRPRSQRRCRVLRAEGRTRSADPGSGGVEDRNPLSVCEDEGIVSEVFDHRRAVRGPSIGPGRAHTHILCRSSNDSGRSAAFGPGDLQKIPDSRSEKGAAPSFSSSEEPEDEHAGRKFFCITSRNAMYFGVAFPPHRWRIVVVLLIWGA